MSDLSKYVQIRKATLYTSIGPNDVTIKLLKFFTLDGDQLTMADFGGSIGFGTLEPGTLQEEIISFTGISYDTSGTVASLTGVTRKLFGIAPYTAGADPHGHNAGRIFIITNNPQFYDRFANKYNDEDIIGVWTFFAAGNGANPLIDDASYNQSADEEYIHKGFADRTYLLLDGSSTMLGDLDMGGFNIINMADAVNPQDAVTLNQLQSAIIGGALPATTLLAGLVLIATQADWDNTVDTETIGLNTYYNIPPISMIQQGILDYIAANVLVAQQTFGLALTNTAVSGDYGLNGGTSSTDGIAMYILLDTTIPEIRKYIKDTNTGFYVFDSTNTAQGSPNDQEVWGAAEIGTKVYWSYVDTGVATVDRFDVAGLANPVQMTFVGTVPNGADERKPCYTDGADLYIHSSGGTYFRYTISGTTLTYVIGGDVGLNTNAMGFAFDGVNVVGRYNGILRNFVPSTGAVNSTQSINTPNPGLSPAIFNSNANPESGIALAGTTKVYLPVCYYMIEPAASDHQFSMTLFPATKPQ